MQNMQQNLPVFPGIDQSSGGTPYNKSNQPPQVAVAPLVVGGALAAAVGVVWGYIDGSRDRASVIGFNASAVLATLKVGVGLGLGGLLGLQGLELEAARGLIGAVAKAASVSGTLTIALSAGYGAGYTVGRSGVLKNVLDAPFDAAGSKVHDAFVYLKNELYKMRQGVGLSSLPSDASTQKQLALTGRGIAAAANAKQKRTGPRIG